MTEQTTLIVPDFTETRDPVAPGAYKVRVVASEVGTWAGKDGKPATTYVKWTLETFSEVEAKNNGRRIYHTTPTNGSFAFRLKDFFKAAMHEECTGAFDTTQLYGKELEVTYGPQSNKPEYNEVKSTKAISH